MSLLDTGGQSFVLCTCAQRNVGTVTMAHLFVNFNFHLTDAPKDVVQHVVAVKSDCLKLTFDEHLCLPICRVIVGQGSTPQQGEPLNHRKISQMSRCAWHPSNSQLQCAHAPAPAQSINLWQTCCMCKKQCSQANSHGFDFDPTDAF